MFDQGFFNQQRLRLEQLRDDLLKDLRGVSHVDVLHHVQGKFEPTYPSMGDDEEQNVAEEAQYESNISAERPLEEDLSDVNAALQELDAGTYGRCQNCGQEILQERLEALPQARLCLACANR